jgi:hypothetical protein
MGIAKKNRRNLLTLARKHEAEAIALLAAQPEREAVAPGYSSLLRHGMGFCSTRRNRAMKQLWRYCVL